MEDSLDLFKADISNQLSLLCDIHIRLVGEIRRIADGIDRLSSFFLGGDNKNAVRSESKSSD